MEEARAVLARLERIEALEREGAGAASLLAELRELVREATAWADQEHDPRALDVAAALAEAQQSAGDDGSQDAYEALVPWPSAAGSIE